MDQLRGEVRSQHSRLVTQIERELRRNQQDKNAINLKQLLLGLKQAEFMRNQRLVE